MRAAQLEFDAANHIYRLKGRKLWGVTDVLQEAGLLANFGNEQALERGRRVHKACHLFDDNDLDWESLREEDVPYVQAWQKARREMGLRVLRSEFHVFNRRYGYAGTPDVLGRRGRRARCIVERKTGELLPAAGVQAAAYAQALPGRPVLERFAVELRADGSYGVKEFPLSKFYRDFLVFLSALRVAEWKRSEA